MKWTTNREVYLKLHGAVQLRGAGPAEVLMRRAARSCRFAGRFSQDEDAKNVLINVAKIERYVLINLSRVLLEGLILGLFSFRSSNQ
jgi:hypothetical protein